MKIVVAIFRYIVGILFISSGLIKANDPLGLSYKMEEFFAKWNWNWLMAWSLPIAVTMILLEVFFGVALLLGWKSKYVTRFLLLLILFFTLLTGYAFLSGKFHSCGCFGDCITITPGASFTKDIALLLMIILLCFYHKKIQPVLKATASQLLLLLTTMATALCMLYVLWHLPFIDCLPYAKGKDIAKQMERPLETTGDSVAVYFKYKKMGEVIRFDASHFPEDFNDSAYTYVDRENIIIKKGNIASPIVDFMLKNTDGEDVTQQILAQTKAYVLFFLRDFDGSAFSWKIQFEKIYNICKEKNIPLILVTNTAAQVQQYFNESLAYHCLLLVCDGTVMKTFLRAKTGMVVMNGSVIKEKFNVRNVDAALDALKK